MLRELGVQPARQLPADLVERAQSDLMTDPTDPGEAPILR